MGGGLLPFQKGGEFGDRCVRRISPWIKTGITIQLIYLSGAWWELPLCVKLIEHVIIVFLWEVARYHRGVGQQQDACLCRGD